MRLNYLINLEENKPTNILKRVVAGLIDMVLLFFIHFGLYSLALITPLGNLVNNYTDALKMIQDNCKLETGYGEVVQIEKGKEDNYHLYTAYKEDGTTVDYYYIIKNVEFATPSDKQAKYNEYVSKIKEDKSYTVTTYLGKTFTLTHSEASTYRHIHNYLLTISIGFVLEALFFLTMPLIKNIGQTPGMWVAGIRMISVKDYLKPKWTQYLGRFLFIFFVESALPYFFLAEYTLLVVPGVLFLFLLFFKAKNRTLHDLVSGIMVIEKITFVDHSIDKDIIDYQEVKENKD